MLASRDLFLELIRKTQLIHSQVSRITLFTLEIQFLFNIRNDESYLTLKGTVMRIDKLNRHDHFNQGFGREKNENRTDLCLRSSVFSFESGCL